MNKVTLVMRYTIGGKFAGTQTVWTVNLEMYPTGLYKLNFPYSGRPGSGREEDFFRYCTKSVLEMVMRNPQRGYDGASGWSWEKW